MTNRTKPESCPVCGENDFESELAFPREEAGKLDASLIFTCCNCSYELSPDPHDCCATCGETKPIAELKITREDRGFCAYCLTCISQGRKNPVVYDLYRALQRLEDLGGVESTHEYIRVMEGLEREVRRRINAAKNSILPPDECPF